MEANMRVIYTDITLKNTGDAAMAMRGIIKEQAAGVKGRSSVHD
jgi:hypothetical protein